MIRISNAKKSYNRGKRNQVTAIDNTSLEFADKGLVAILGNSGCGKTTLLNMIGGLDTPDSGSIYINGKKMNSIFSGKTDNIRNRYIGYIFQNYHLIDDMTVFNNVALPLRMLGVKDKSKIRECVYYALEMVGLYRYRNRPASALSGGERQRVGIARAIVKNPDIIIADEPTGNLDSGNTIEIMNIIKAISKEKLVILVTHEKELAYFYADRIIDIVDGKITGDRENEHDNTLDYRIDNKIYLQDFEQHKSFSEQGINVNLYSDTNEKSNITIVIRNGNIYIQSDDRKTEIVDSNSPIEFIDDHYHAISLDDAEKNKFDFSKLGFSGKKIRYHSVFNIINIFSQGMQKIRSYTAIKKVLLLGFVASAMFVMYAISNILGISTINEEDFTAYNRNYLQISTKQNTVEAFLEAENLPGVKYVLWGDSKTRFSISYSDLYYQTAQASDSFSGSLSSSDTLDEASIVYGKNVSSDMDIVVDLMLINNIVDNGESQMVGFSAPEDFIGRTCTVSNNNFDDNSDLKFTIVGICETHTPVVFTMESMFYKIQTATLSEQYDEENNAVITDINEAQGKLTIVKGGRLPESAYEVILQKDYMYQYKLGAKLTEKVSGQKLTVVGFYTSSVDGEDSKFVTSETIKYKNICMSSGLMIYPDDKEAVLDYYNQKGTQIVDTYEKSKSTYEKSMSDTIRSTIILALIIMGISLIEIYLMLRSSFLSRIKEVGTYRAIGLKKKDIYKMFLGEILCITTITAPIAFLIMGKILSTLTKISYFSNMYVFNSTVVAASAVIIYAFNILVGLLPVITTLGKTPAKILARTDVD